MIEERFRIATWTNWSGFYQELGCWDGAVSVASYNGERIYANPSCGGVEELEWLFDARKKTQEQLIEKGTAWAGSIRYCLVYDAAAVESTVPDLLQYQNAPQWPLSSTPADLAIYEGEDLNGRIDLSYLAGCSE